MSEENNKIVGGTRIPELDIMKLVGIVLVVVGHVTRIFTPQGLIPQADDTGIMDILTKVIYSFHMPLFVFVSGMTFALIATRRGNYHNIISFMRKKTMRLMIPYFSFAILWVLPFMVGFGFRDLKSYFINGICLSLDSRHLWYVWMLFNVFLLVYILRIVINKVKLAPYFLLPISCIILIFEMRWGKIPYFQIDNSLVYQFWFILGYIAMIYRKYLNILFSILIIVVLGFIERASLLYALLGIYAIYLLSLRLTYLTRFTFINKVNSNIFGIYLFHPVIIYLFFYYLDKSEIGVLPITVSVVVISFILSFYLTELMRKLHLNLLIGEKRQNDRHK